MTRRHSLLIIGRAYTPPIRFPRCDATWTTLSTVVHDPAIQLIPDLLVWDCHKKPADAPDIPIYDLRDDLDKWGALVAHRGRTFANQLCYMLADVGTDTSSFASVTLLGCQFADPAWRHEAQYIAYHLGYLRAKGVAYTIIPPSDILPPFTYAMEDHYAKSV